MWDALTPEDVALLHRTHPRLAQHFVAISNKLRGVTGASASDARKGKASPGASAGPSSRRGSTSAAASFADAADPSKRIRRPSQSRLLDAMVLDEGSHWGGTKGKGSRGGAEEFNATAVVLMEDAGMENLNVSDFSEEQKALIK
jgi:hypothetical protein